MLEKVELLKKLEQGFSVKAMSDHYSIGISTVYDIRKWKEQIFKFFAENESRESLKSRKTLREYPLIQ